MLEVARAERSTMKRWWKGDGQVTRREHALIVGGGLAGAKTAESLRGWGFEGNVTIVGEEAHQPYQRPPLSKSYLRGSSSFEEALAHSSSFYAEHDIELLTSTKVISIEPRSRTVQLGTGNQLAWDHLVLATGARPRRLTIPGEHLDGVYYLRTLDDCDALRAAVGLGRRAVIVGAGWIGTEVAASLRRMGTEVALAYRSPVPFQATLGADVGAVLSELHRAHGVELYAGATPLALRGRDRVEALELADGRVLDVDVVVIGIGAEPASELAGAGVLAVEDGVLTDARLRTSAPGIFAVGDVASIEHPLFHGRVRSRHWWSALTQPATVAANIVGVPALYDWVPTFTSKQYDLMIEYTGYATSWDSLVLRGDLASARFAAFWLADAIPVAGLTAGIAGLQPHLRAIVAARKPIDPRLLADPDVDLATLIPAQEAPQPQIRVTRGV